MPDFAIWPQCNIGCVFCSNPVSGFRETTAEYGYEALARKLAEYKTGFRRFLKFDEVGDYFNLTGGEPTLHPDFLKLLALVRSEFPGTLVRLLTNGRMFAYESFARRALGVGQAPFEAAIPLFGHDAKTHEGISRAPRSFEQTVAGLRNVLRFLRPGQKLEIRIILNRLQLRHLGPTLDFILEEFPRADRVVFLFTELEGFAERYRDVLQATMSECAQRLDREHEKLVRFREVRIYHFPLCVVPIRLWPFVYNTLAPFKVSFLPRCGGCAYRGQCVGVHRSYAKHMGAPDIRPIESARPVRLSGNPYHPVDSVELSTGRTA